MIESEKVTKILYGGVFVTTTFSGWFLRRQIMHGAVGYHISLLIL